MFVARLPVYDAIYTHADRGYSTKKILERLVNHAKIKVFLFSENCCFEYLDVQIYYRLKFLPLFCLRLPTADSLFILNLRCTCRIVLPQMLSSSPFRRAFISFRSNIENGLPQQAKRINFTIAVRLLSADMPHSIKSQGLYCISLSIRYSTLLR